MYTLKIYPEANLSNYMFIIKDRITLQEYLKKFYLKM